MSYQKMLKQYQQSLTKDLINKSSTLNEAKCFFFRNISKLFSIYTS